MKSAIFFTIHPCFQSKGKVEEKSSKMSTSGAGASIWGTLCYTVTFFVFDIFCNKTVTQKILHGERGKSFPLLTVSKLDLWLTVLVTVTSQVGVALAELRLWEHSFLRMLRSWGGADARGQHRNLHIPFPSINTQVSRPLTSFVCLLLQNKVHIESWKQSHKWFKGASQPPLPPSFKPNQWVEECPLNFHIYLGP